MKVKNIFLYDTIMEIVFDNDIVWEVPLELYPTLLKASNKDRNCRVIGDGSFNSGIHWPALDYDLSIENIARGIPETTKL